MPIFEFKCSDCEEFFEILFMSGDDAKEIKCPKCSSSAVERVVSSTNYAMGASSASKQQTASTLTPELFQRLLHHIYSSRGQQGIKIEGLIKILTILIKIRQAPHIDLILACSHSIRMLRSPRYAKMGHWPNIYIPPRIFTWMPIYPYSFSHVVYPCTSTIHPKPVLVRIQYPS